MKAFILSISFVALLAGNAFATVFSSSVLPELDQPFIPQAKYTHVEYKQPDIRFEEEKLQAVTKRLPKHIWAEDKKNKTSEFEEREETLWQNVRSCLQVLIAERVVSLYDREARGNPLLSKVFRNFYPLVHLEGRNLIFIVDYELIDMDDM